MPLSAEESRSLFFLVVPAAVKYEMEMEAGVANYENSRLKVVRLSENAILPKKMTPGSVGFDLFTPNQLEIEPGRQRLGKFRKVVCHDFGPKVTKKAIVVFAFLFRVVHTDLSLIFPEGTYGRYVTIVRSETTRSLFIEKSLKIQDCREIWAGTGVCLCIFRRAGSRLQVTIFF